MLKLTKYLVNNIKQTQNIPSGTWHNPKVSSFWESKKKTPCTQSSWKLVSTENSQNTKAVDNYSLDIETYKIPTELATNRYINMNSIAKQSQSFEKPEVILVVNK